MGLNILPMLGDGLTHPMISAAKTKS